MASAIAEVVGSGGGSPSRKKKSSLVEGAVMISTSTTFLFEVDEYEDLVTLPLLGTRKTRCKFTAIQPLNEIDLSLLTGRSLRFIAQQGWSGPT